MNDDEFQRLVDASFAGEEVSLSDLMEAGGLTPDVIKSVIALLPRDEQAAATSLLESSRRDSAAPDGAAMGQSFLSHLSEEHNVALVKVAAARRLAEFAPDSEESLRDRAVEQTVTTFHAEQRDLSPEERENRAKLNGEYIVTTAKRISVEVFKAILKQRDSSAALTGELDVTKETQDESDARVKAWRRAWAEERATRLRRAKSLTKRLEGSVTASTATDSFDGVRRMELVDQVSRIHRIGLEELQEMRTAVDQWKPSNRKRARIRKLSAAERTWVTLIELVQSGEQWTFAGLAERSDMSLREVVESFSLVVGAIRTRFAVGEELRKRSA